MQNYICINLIVYIEYFFLVLSINSTKFCEVYAEQNEINKEKKGKKLCQWGEKYKSKFYIYIFFIYFFLEYKINTS